MKKSKAKPPGGLALSSCYTVTIEGVGHFMFGADEMKQAKAFARLVSKGYIPPGVPKMRKGQKNMPVFRRQQL